MAFLNIINQVKENISETIEKKGYEKVNFVVEHSKCDFGDITCNVAFLLAKNLKKNPMKLLKNLHQSINLKMK